jgi:hypothetical protein
MAGASAFGSAAWTGGEEYGGEYTERIDDFLCKVNTSALLSYASSLRGNRSCTLSREFSVGNFNLVRNLEFEDGVSWIARLRMPSMPDSTPVPPLISRKGALGHAVRTRHDGLRSVYTTWAVFFPHV